jgi:hypothetical protein
MLGSIAESFVGRFKRRIYVDHMKNIKQKQINKIPLRLDGSERSMIPILKNYSNTMWNNTDRVNHVALEEFAAGDGISDLTVFSFDQRAIESRLKGFNDPITGKFAVKVLIAVLNGSSTIEQIAKSTGVKSERTILTILDTLSSTGFVKSTSKGYVSEYDLSILEGDRILAIEAKVKDWKSGVRQAMRYKEYADYSYLAIYEDHIKPCLKHLGVFEQLGLGLVGVSDQGLQVYLRAQQSDIQSLEDKLLAFERYISVIDQRYQSFVAWNGFTTNHIT